MRSMIYAGLGGVIVWAVIMLTAHSITAQAPSDAERVQQLEAQLKSAQAKLQTPEVRQATAERIYSDVYRTAKQEAQAACREAGGKLWVMVSRTPGQPTTTSVSCEMR